MDGGQGWIEGGGFDREGGGRGEGGGRLVSAVPTASPRLASRARGGGRMRRGSRAPLRPPRRTRRRSRIARGAARAPPPSEAATRSPRRPPSRRLVLCGGRGVVTEGKGCFARRTVKAGVASSVNAPAGRKSGRAPRAEKKNRRDAIRDRLEWTKSVCDWLHIGTRAGHSGRAPTFRRVGTRAARRADARDARGPARRRAVARATELARLRAASARVPPSAERRGPARGGRPACPPPAASIAPSPRTHTHPRARPPRPRAPGPPPGRPRRPRVRRGVPRRGPPRRDPPRRGRDAEPPGRGVVVRSRARKI